MTRIPSGASQLPVPSLCLVVLDGWGLAPDGPGNAVSRAETPTFDGFWARCPHATLSTWSPHAKRLGAVRADACT